MVKCSCSALILYFMALIGICKIICLTIMILSLLPLRYYICNNNLELTILLPNYEEQTKIEILIVLIDVLLLSILFHLYN
jgi:hypothetical protein